MMYSPGRPYIVVAPVVTSWAVAGQRMVFFHMFLQARVTLEAFPIVAPRGRSSKFPWRGTYRYWQAGIGPGSGGTLSGDDEVGLLLRKVSHQFHVCDQVHYIIMPCELRPLSVLLHDNRTPLPGLRHTPADQINGNIHFRQITDGRDNEGLITDCTYPNMPERKSHTLMTWHPAY